MAWKKEFERLWVYFSTYPVMLEAKHGEWTRYGHSFLLRSAGQNGCPVKEELFFRVLIRLFKPQSPWR